VDWIYLSAHLDDAIYSCGGLIWEQARAGEKVAVWTFCAGDPPAGPLSPFAESLHDRWNTGREAAALRREEDRLACSLVGAAPRHFSIPDCIYRRSPVDGTALYSTEEEIFGSLHPADAGLAAGLSQELLQAAPVETHLVCPLGLGGHVDHQLTRASAEATKRSLWYYADYPYVLEAIAAYASQVSTFWEDRKGMHDRLQAYVFQTGGVRLWRFS
jgi:LmbE family N-acetylglucosaminyl deacetylase